jgi:acetylornithine deacetylase/succinyl-diaminopimelate desuccinylase-like protein
VTPFLTWVERFIATPSVSRDGNAAIAAHALELLSEIGASARLCEVVQDGVTHANVIADAGSGSDDGLLLVTHLDTVPPGPAAAWTATGGDPFRPTYDGDKLFGLGSADAKVDFVCKAFALASIPSGVLRRRVRLVGTFGEEIGLCGARELVRSGGASGFRFALVGEPSELACVVAHKGYAALSARVGLSAAARATRRPAERITFTGRASHSSTPGLGRNAIELALERLAEADVRGLSRISGGTARNQVPDNCALEINGDVALDHHPLIEFRRTWTEWLRTLASPRDERFDPATSVASLNLVQTDGNDVVFTFDLRPLPGLDPETLIKPLQTSARVEALHSDPPLSTPLDADVVRAVQGAQGTIGLSTRLATKPTCTEAGVLSAAGLETVVIGAGRSTGNVHRPNEYTLVSQLKTLRELYGLVIRQLAA